MPKYRPTQVPDIIDLPLDDLARRDSHISDADVAMRVRTALHESAHLVAAAYCRAYVYRVEINSAVCAKRAGEYGGVSALGILPGDEAFIALVGLAWEELHGDVADAACDRRDGRQFADEADESFEDLLNEARQFARDAEELIRCMAAAILALVPKSGALKNRTLSGLLRWVRPEDPALYRGPTNAAKKMHHVHQN